MGRKHARLVTEEQPISVLCRSEGRRKSAQIALLKARLTGNQRHGPVVIGKNLMSHINHRAVMRKLGAICLLGLFPLTTACSPLLSAAAALKPPEQAPLATADPLASATPTPFMPLDSTATPTPITPTATPTEVPPTSTPTPTPEPTATAPPPKPASSKPWGSYPRPSVASPTQIPKPMPKVNVAPDVINIILLGSDRRPRWRSHRTDTMMILSLNPSAGTATMVSIPRDLYVYIPGWMMQRINTADQRGGRKLVAMTIEYNLGIEIHHWVLIEFGEFRQTIKTLGGIDVQVAKRLYDRCRGKTYSFSPGLHHMGPWTAFCYVRMRKASSDIDRLRRQQEVMVAIFNKLLTLDALSRAPEIYDQFGALVKTDLELGDILPLIPLGASLASDPSRIHRYSINWTMVKSWRVPGSGAAVLLPRRKPLRTMLNSALGQ